jgi:ATP-dependent DNA helicase RecQ
MSSDDWACAQGMLRAWPAIPPDHPAEGTCRRLRDALIGLSGTEAGWQDVACLTRQVLLEQAARHGVQVPLRVPGEPPFPSRQQWQDTECSAIPDGPAFSVTARPWHPPIRIGESDRVAREDLQWLAQGSAPPSRACHADPFWRAALGYPGYISYISLGQRQAARTVILAPPGSTTIVCLPTGHGKTEVALAAALLASQDRGVSVLVVPTVVLGLDMERRIWKLLEDQGERQSPTGRYAYSGGLADPDKRAMRQAVQDGRQRVLVTSPEALVTGLSASLTAAAAAGHLRYMIIDEAHLVDQWGSDFRPEFQTMASQRLAWLSAAPPGRQVTTIAMSATLTGRHIRALTDLFAPQGEAAIVWGSQTRPEPSYYLENASDEQARRRAVLVAVALLPRPLALYATKREDVTSWVTALRASGLRRITQVTGESDDEERKSAIEGWRGEDSHGQVIPTRHDIVVGTSAFGLGVDMRDVRSVVHTCLPETLDRYYQEVGRGGRDGRPSIACLTAAPGDYAVARQLNQRVVISADKGWDRWQSMWHDATPTDSGVYEVSLDSCPTHMSEGYDRNRQWNVRTLNLMAWAGLIQLRAPQPPARADGEPLAEWTARLDAYYARADARVAVQIIDGSTNLPDYWRDAVSIQRASAVTGQRAALEGMLEVLRGNRCIGETLADYYRITWHGGILSTGVNCRSCPWCRTNRADDRNALGMCRSAGEPFPAVHCWAAVAPDPLVAVRGTSPWVSISWADKTERNDLLPQLLERLVRRGMPVIGGPGIDAPMADRVQDAALPAPVIIDYDDDLAATFSGPVIWVLDEAADSLDDAIRVRLASTDLTYLIHPRSLPDLVKPGVRLVQVCDASVSLTTALGAL